MQQEGKSRCRGAHTIIACICRILTAHIMGADSVYGESARRHRVANELGGGWSLCRSLSFRPNPSNGAVRLSLRVARFFSIPLSTGLPYDIVLLVDVLIATPITGAWLWSCAVLGRRSTPDVWSARGDEGVCKLSLGNARNAAPGSSRRSRSAACGDAGRGGRGWSCGPVSRTNLELLEPTVAPAVDGLRGSLLSAEVNVLPLWVLGSSGVDFL